MREPAGPGRVAPMLLELTAWILAVCMGALALLWTLMMARLVLTQRGLPHVCDALTEGPPVRDWPRVSVIMPTHNEQTMLEACLASVRAQDYADLQIIVALDRCSDASPDIARRHAEQDPRIIVTPNDTTRDGWRGKCLPMQVGSEHADGQWLLFIDSDTELEPQLVRAAVATAVRHGFEMLSIMPELRCRKLFEHVAQPVASLQLMQIFPPHKVNRTDGRSKPFSMGAFTLLRRDRYDAIGGMAAVRHLFMEDIHLARAVSHSGGRVGIAQGHGVFRCVMYETFREFMDGWKRIFIGATSQRIRRMRSHARRLFAAGLGIPALQLAALGAALTVGLEGDRPGLALTLTGLTVLALVLQLLVLGRFYRATGASRFASLLFPIGAVIIGLILRRGASDLQHSRPFHWGGHDYAPPPW